MAGTPSVVISPVWLGPQFGQDPLAWLGPRVLLGPQHGQDSQSAKTPNVAGTPSVAMTPGMTGTPSVVRTPAWLGPQFGWDPPAQPSLGSSPQPPGGLTWSLPSGGLRRTISAYWGSEGLSSAGAVGVAAAGEQGMRGGQELPHTLPQAPQSHASSQGGGRLHLPGSAAFSLFIRQHQKAPPKLTASRMRVRTMYPDFEKDVCPPGQAERAVPTPHQGLSPPPVPSQPADVGHLCIPGARVSPPLWQMACRSKRTTFWSAGLLTVQA